MISVCYLSLSRRWRAVYRWCSARAPGGCWMWLGKEQKTTKITVWCTAKVSSISRLLYTVCYLPSNTTAAKHTVWQTIPPLKFCCMSVSLSFTRNISIFFYIPLKSFSVSTQKSWLGVGKQHTRHKVSGFRFHKVNIFLCFLYTVWVNSSLFTNHNVILCNVGLLGVTVEVGSLESQWNKNEGFSCCLIQLECPY